MSRHIEHEKGRNSVAIETFYRDTTYCNIEQLDRDRGRVDAEALVVTMKIEFKQQRKKFLSRQENLGRDMRSLLVELPWLRQKKPML